MRILALDQGAFTGFCHGVPGEEVRCGTHRLPKGQMSRQHLALEAFLIDIIKGNGIVRVYYEQPNDQQKSSVAARRAGYGREAVIGLTCARLGINCYPIMMQTWRSQAGVPTSAPRRIKDRGERRDWMKDQARQRFVALFDREPEDDNAAEAGLIWHSVAQKHVAKASAPMFDILEGLDV